MKKNILSFLMTLSLLMAADIQAQSCQSPCYADIDQYCESPCYIDEMNFYAKILGGPNFLQSTTIDGNKSTYQTGYMIAGSLGYCWRYGLRLEGEYAFRRNTIKKIHSCGQGFSKHGYFQTSSCMANVLWDLPLSLCGCTFWNIQPFIGAGIGYDFHDAHSSNSRIICNQKWNHFAWQVMGGLAYPVFCNAEIILDYKFHQGRSHLYNHSIGVGFLYKFSFLR